LAMRAMTRTPVIRDAMDWIMKRALAHSLKGMLSTLAAQDAAAAAQRLEDMGRGGSLDAAPAAFAGPERRVEVLGANLAGLCG